MFKIDWREVRRCPTLLSRPRQARLREVLVNSETFTTATASATDAMMICPDCDLTGGPFSPAEAEHLSGIHARMFHGVLAA
jgi:hypothetical protein